MATKIPAMTHDYLAQRLDGAHDRHDTRRAHHWDALRNDPLVVAQGVGGVVSSVVSFALLPVVFAFSSYDLDAQNTA